MKTAKVIYTEEASNPHFKAVEKHPKVASHLKELRGKGYRLRDAEHRRKSNTTSFYLKHPNGEAAQVTHRKHADGAKVTLTHFPDAGPGIRVSTDVASVEEAAHNPRVRKLAHHISGFLPEETKVRPHMQDNDHYVIHNHGGYGRAKVLKMLKDRGYKKHPASFNKGEKFSSYKHPEHDLIVSVPKTTRVTSPYHVHVKPTQTAAFEEAEAIVAQEEETAGKAWLAPNRGKLSRIRKDVDHKMHSQKPTVKSKDPERSRILRERREAEAKARSIHKAKKARLKDKKIMSTEAEHHQHNATKRNTKPVIASDAHAGHLVKELRQLTGGDVHQHNTIKNHFFIEKHGGMGREAVEHHLEDSGFHKWKANRGSGHNYWTHPHHDVVVAVPRANQKNVPYMVYHSGRKIKPETAKSRLHNIDHQGYRWHVNTGKSFTVGGHRVETGHTFGVRPSRRVTHLVTQSGHGFRVKNEQAEQVLSQSKAHNVFHH